MSDMPGTEASLIPIAYFLVLSVELSSHGIQHRRSVMWSTDQSKNLHFILQVQNVHYIVTTSHWHHSSLQVCPGPMLDRWALELHTGKEEHSS